MGIYLDHNAGAPLRPEVKVILEEFLRSDAGNPSSIHRQGQHARRLLETARAQVAALIGADARQVVFTSGGTESNNSAIRAAAYRSPQRKKIVSSAIEHSSVLEPLRHLDREGFQIFFAECDANGQVATDAVLGALDSSTALVTLGLANAEVGTIQDLALIRASASNVGAIFHVDAAQALGRIKVPVNELGCDLMTLSGHKIGAPSGIGALFVRDPAQFSPLMLGGPQENGLRAGTPNLLGAVGFGAAAEAVLSSLEQEASRMTQLSELLLKLLTDAIPGIRLNGPRDRRLPNTLNLTFPSVSGETLLIALDLEGVLSSMGSACAAGAVEPSHVLLAMGRSPMQARSSLRLSLGPQNTQTEIERAAEIISRVWRTVVEAEPSKAENFDAETLA